MKKKRELHLNFIIDRLTNSIQNTISGDVFQTEVSRFSIKDSKQTIRKNGWNFNWSEELDNDTNEVYKLTIVNNPEVIQGVLSVRLESDHVFMNLLESAPFNLGKDKLYEGVAGNLVAFACKLSFQYGFERFVVFTAKTKLISHYKISLEAKHIGSNRMIIETHAAKFLVEKYFKT